MTTLNCDTEGGLGMVGPGTEYQCAQILNGKSPVGLYGDSWQMRQIQETPVSFEKKKKIGTIMLHQMSHQNGEEETALKGKNEFHFQICELRKNI